MLSIQEGGLIARVRYVIPWMFYFGWQCISIAFCSFRVEFTSGKWRSIVGHWFGEVPWQVGHLSLGLLVYLLPNMRHLELFIGLSALPFMSLWWLLPESPRWLLSKVEIKIEWI